MIKGAAPAVYFVHDAQTCTCVDGAVVEESTVRIYANGQEFVSLMCSPVDLEALGVGLLYNEGLIESLDGIEMVKLSNRGMCVDVWLRGDIALPGRPIRTSGCGGGVTFDDLTAQAQPLPAGAVIDPQQVIDRYFELRAIETLYPVTRGVHASALCSPDDVLLWAEDVGRHNTLDKLAGKALLNGIDTVGLLIVTTGRISSEMLGKAARMGVPVVASRTSPTSRSLALADARNMTVIGYIRRTSMRIYTAPERMATAPLTMEIPVEHELSH